MDKTAVLPNHSCQNQLSIIGGAVFEGMNDGAIAGPDKNRRLLYVIDLCVEKDILIPNIQKAKKNYH